MAADRTRDRLLRFLKESGPLPTRVLGFRLGISAAAARQHLLRLTAEGLVHPEDRRESVGRPKRYWSLTAAGHAGFPDGHAGLALELVDAVERLFGAEDLDRLIADRERSQLDGYRAQLAVARSPWERVALLAAIRNREGYMARACAEAEGSFLLVEDHCPICTLAMRCRGLCASELTVFQEVLGPEVEVERTDHLLAGARRCAYRITPRRVLVEEARAAQPSAGRRATKAAS